jgi:hypothetical protein
MDEEQRQAKMAIISELRGGMFAAMREKLLAGVRARASELPAHKRSKRAELFAQKRVERALSEAERRSPSVPVAVTLAFILSRHSLTSGIVNIGEYIRHQIFSRHPMGDLVREVYHGLERGESPERKKMDAARRALYSLEIREAIKIGIDPRSLAEFGYSLHKGLMGSFPLLELKPEAFGYVAWSNPEEKAQNTRYRIFLNNPGLEEEIKKVEQILAKPIIDTEEAKFINRVRLKLLDLVTVINLTKWRLSRAKDRSIFRNLKELLDACFPFIHHPFFERFFNNYDLQDAADLQRLYKRIKADFDWGSDATAFANRQRRPQATIQLISLEDLLTRFEKRFYESWETGRFLRRRGQLSREELFQVFLIMAAHRESTQQAVIRDLHRIRKEHRSFISPDLVRWNCPWVRKYGIGFFQDLFGMGIAGLLKSKLFWS